MKSCIAYIILFLTTFIFPSVAQDSYIEYEYVDGTKERNTIGTERFYCRYYQNEGSSYRIKTIYIDNVFDTLIPNIGSQIFDKLIFGFNDGELSYLTGPRYIYSMGDRLDNYDYKLDKVDPKTRIMAVSFNSNKLPNFAYHNGKQISSISGHIFYSKLRNVPSTILNDELKDNLKPFYPTSLIEKSDGSYLDFVSPSYNGDEKNTKLNGLSLERVKVINNLKRMGYTLTSQKGVFPLTYQNDKGSSILMYETYIMVKVTE